jgi:hypothetical protein
MDGNEEDWGRTSSPHSDKLKGLADVSLIGLFKFVLF